MKQGIHPEFMVATVNCACGNTFETMATQDSVHLDICAVCHPFYTGKQRLVDTAGRVDRFQRKYGTKAAVAEPTPDAEPTADAESTADAAQ